MPRQALRTLALIDAIALIAATAVALAIARAAQPGLRGLYGSTVWMWINLSTPFGILWMLSILGLRSLPPRPPLRRLARRPGMVACCVATVYTAWTVAWIGLWAARRASTVAPGSNTFRSARRAVARSKSKLGRSAL